MRVKFEKHLVASPFHMTDTTQIVTTKDHDKALDLMVHDPSIMKIHKEKFPKETRRLKGIRAVYKQAGLRNFLVVLNEGVV
jgi:hypothetical protein